MADSYVKLRIPKSGLNIPTSVLEQYLNSLCDLIIKYGSSNLDLDKIVEDYEIQKKEIKLSLEKQHNSQIEELKQQIKNIYADANLIAAERSKTILLELENKNTTIADLNKQITNLRKTITKELSNGYIEEIKKEKERVAEFMQSRIDLLNNTNNELKQQIKSIKSDAEANIADRIKSLQLTMQYETESKNKVIEDLRNQLTSVRQSITNELLSKHEIEKKAQDKQIAILESNLNDYRSKQPDTKQVHDQLTTISETIKPLIKFYTGSNEEKGTSGENLIAKILKTNDKYADGIVIDTSKQTAKGDLLFKWRQLKCMIEIKNKKTITIDDMEKFARDVNELNTNINCAIFVSLNTDIFPGRTRDLMQVDFINGTVVVYTYISYNESIHYVIACLEKIVASNITGTEQNKLLIKYFTDYYNYLNKTRQYFEKSIITKNKEIKQYSKFLEECNKLSEEIHPDYLKLSNISLSISENGENGEYNDENDENNDENNDETEETNTNKININLENSEECIEQIKQLYIKLTLNKQPNKLTNLLALTSIDQKTFDTLGGYDDIIASAKLDYTASILTPTIVKNILSHKETNGTYPTRKDIVQKKIMTDASIRRLFSVIKSKKQIEYIINYCESQTENFAEHETQSNEHIEPIEPIEHIKSVKKVKVKVNKTKTKKQNKNPIDEPIDEKVEPNE